LPALPAVQAKELEPYMLCRWLKLVPFVSGLFSEKES
jgi:hypothetical protein